MHIWYLHAYAGGPGIGPLYRPYELGRAWRKAGHEVTVITASRHHHLYEPGPMQNRTIEGVQYVAVPTREYSGNGLGRILSMIDYARGIGRLKDVRRPDAIVVSSPHPFAYLSAERLAKKHGAKLAFEVRDLWPLSLVKMLGVSRLHPLVLLLGWIERRAYRKSDVVVSLLQGVRKYIGERGIAPKAFHWAPNGVTETPLTAPTSKTARAAAQQIADWKAEGRVVLIYAGSIGPPNGVDLLVEALRKVGPEVRALIIGHGGCYDEVAAMAADMPNVVVMPAVPRHEALYLVSKSDIGYGGLKAQDEIFCYGTAQNKVMDYMLCGLPVLFPVKAYRDPVSESGGGIVVHDANPDTVAAAITSLAANRDGMGERGRAYVLKHHRWEDIAAGYVDALFPEPAEPVETKKRRAAALEPA